MKPDILDKEKREVQTPEYLKRTILAFERNPELFPKGELSHQFVKHDHWCALLVQRMACDCNPDIEIEVRGTRCRILPDGELQPIM
jgi:hypothetical protein